MSSNNGFGWDHADADTWAKTEIKRRQAEATLVELPVEQAHDILRRIRTILWPAPPTEPASWADTVDTIAATLNNRGLGLGAVAEITSWPGRFTFEITAHDNGGATLEIKGV